MISPQDQVQVGATTQGHNDYFKYSHLNRSEYLYNIYFKYEFIAKESLNDYEFDLTIAVAACSFEESRSRSLKHEQSSLG